jgi:hypothetical protein
MLFHKLSNALARVVVILLMLQRRPLLRRLNTLVPLISKYIVCSMLAVTFLSSQTAKADFSWWFWTPGDTVDHVGYQPDQPIPFSHKLHAGERQIPCQYCHSSARRSITSGIPPLNTCMGCHRFVKTDSPHIKYVTDKYKKNEPIEWVKVHDLPDFVRFSHQIHVKGAGLTCQECHGAVEEMEKVEQIAPLQMGWCLDCHRKKGANIDCLTCHY